MVWPEAFTNGTLRGAGAGAVLAVLLLAAETLPRAVAERSFSSDAWAERLSARACSRLATRCADWACALSERAVCSACWASRCS